MAILKFFCAVDLGFSADHSAITLLERRTHRELISHKYDYKEWYSYVFSHLKRCPLETPYREIVKLVKDLLDDASHRGECDLIIDITSSENTLKEFAEIKANSIGVKITGGMAESKEKFKLIYHVPKRNLITGLQIAFQNNEIEIPDRLPTAELLINELLTFESEISPSGHDTYGAWPREKAHDDLLLSASLAWWRANQKSFEYSYQDGKTGIWYRQGDRKRPQRIGGGLSIFELERAMREAEE